MPRMLNTETVVTLDEAVSRLPVARNRSTLWRWCRVGIHQVTLEHRFHGGTIVTSMEALDRFFKALADARPAGAPAPSNLARWPRRQTRDIRATSVQSAEAFLAELGI